MTKKKTGQIHGKGITYKIFIITSTLLFSLAIFIYLVIYVFLPLFYYSYKVQVIDQELSFLVESAENQTVNDIFEKINDFSRTRGVVLAIVNHDDYVVMSFPTIVHHFVNDETPVDFSSEQWTEWEGDSALSGERYIYFSDGEYRIYYYATMQPVDDIAQMLFLFIPYLLVVILMFTVFTVTLYTKMITKPLLHMNRVAKKMAILDFSEGCVVKSDDEIGQLSLSLNKMSKNLENFLFRLKRTNRLLKDDIERERALEKRRKEFIATISHELKTPITTVKGQLEAMLHNIGPYKDRDKYLKRSYEVMGDMENLVKEVLSISKLEHFEPQLEEVCIMEVVKDCLRSTDYFFKRKEQELIKSLQPAGIYVDVGLIKKAITNVLGNASKYSPKGATVCVTVTPRPNEIELKVFNSGVEIAEDELEKIFHAFYRLEKSRNRETGGSGLGLYIVQQILDQQKISWEMKNVEGGVVFRMLFIPLEMKKLPAPIQPDYEI